ncbi:hypothetical protein M378DRAFT_821779 [Amanita muscaria Koide BX008]|uniref:Secreted protein n=1 Tax=Amanita muscaria (strain Koide BX008) TaxID=946122 RepID=A0A0C2TND0_AMAMK|nr:hypothetical protein M378DRAFT_821779 [Amanita muscaria Koide BX008]
MSKAAHLVLWIFSRIPVLPRSLFLNVDRITSGEGAFNIEGMRVSTHIDGSTKVFTCHPLQSSCEVREMATNITFRFQYRNRNCA